MIDKGQILVEEIACVQSQSRDKQGEGVSQEGVSQEGETWHRR